MGEQIPIPAVGPVVTVPRLTNEGFLDFSFFMFLGNLDLEMTQSLVFRVFLFSQFFVSENCKFKLVQVSLTK